IGNCATGGSHVRTPLATYCKTNNGQRVGYSRQYHCRLRPTPRGAHYHQIRKKRGQRVCALFSALTTSRCDRHRLGRVLAHYWDLVTVERAEVPSRRADPTGLELLRSEHRDWQAQLCYSAAVGTVGASRRALSL